jgi:hypothetical protein
LEITGVFCNFAEIRKVIASIVGEATFAGTLSG